MTESSSPKDNINPKDQEIDQENEGFYHFQGDYAGQVDNMGGSNQVIIYNHYFAKEDSPQDMYNLLKFAENMKRVCDNYLNQLERLVFFRDCIVLCLIIIAFLTFFSMSNKDWDLSNSSDIIKLIKNFISILTGFGVISLIVSVIINSPIKKLINRLSYEQKILEETVDLLREAGSILKEDRQWTKLQEIEYKIRLSRFDIGKYQIPQSILQEILSRKSATIGYNYLINSYFLFWFWLGFVFSLIFTILIATLTR